MFVTMSTKTFGSEIKNTITLIFPVSSKTHLRDIFHLLHNLQCSGIKESCSNSSQPDRDMDCPVQLRCNSQATAKLK